MKTQLDAYNRYKPLIRPIFHQARRILMPQADDLTVDYKEPKRETKCCQYCDKKFRSTRDFCSDTCAYQWFNSFNHCNTSFRLDAKLKTVNKTRKMIKKSKIGGRHHYVKKNQ